MCQSLLKEGRLDQSAPLTRTVPRNHCSRSVHKRFPGNVL